MANMDNLSVENLKFLGILSAQNQTDAADKARINWGNKLFLVDVVQTGKKTFLVL